MKTPRILVCLLLLIATMPAWADSGQGVNHKLYAVPCPGHVVIDGKLDDWDWSGHIESYVTDESRATQHADCAVMYDADALYIGAHVTDSTPMMNRHNPAADADKAWMGDCCQFRLVTDRNIPFPFRSGQSAAPEYTGQNVGQPLHLMLWYFTDNKEPALQIHKSFAWQPVRPEWGPHGVVPHDHFEAAYRVDNDGKGYTFEYRIPWETLNAKDSHPVAGDVVTATTQFLWGDAGGLVNKVSTYDVMSTAGFPFQDSTCWGKLIFADKGNIPRSWVDPYQKPATPAPLTFTYHLPADGVTSVALYDKDNNVVRHIVAQAPRKAGDIVETWDGKDANGNLLPPGDYHWKGLYHDPITTKYVMSIGNSGQPAWKTADGTGGWGGDYGPCTAAAVAGDKMILGWNGHEAGWGIIATDLTGKKLWGVGQKNATILASDGKRIFANGEGGGGEVNVYSTASGQPMVFGNGRQGLLPPAGGNPAVSNSPSGVAYAQNTLYVSFVDRNVVGVYDATSGDLKATWAIDKPGRLAVAPDGSVLVISGAKIVRSAGGAITDFLTSHIDTPAGIAVDASGTVYVANLGSLQNIGVFSSAAGYLRSIGKLGGRPAVGKYDPSGVLNPAGIAVDGEGKLWVPENAISMKRLSVWNSKTGKLIKEFFGGCSYSPFAWIDSANPHEAFFDNTIWKIDLDKGTWYPKSVFYARKNGDFLDSGNGGFFYPFRVFTAHNGKQYAVSLVWGYGSVLWIRQGDQFKPLYFRFKNRPNPAIYPDPPFTMMNDEKVYPGQANYLWTDANGDEQAQANELTPGSTTPEFRWMDANLNLYGDGVVYRPTKVAKNGVPSYDFAKPERITPGSTGQTWTDSEGSEFWGWHEGGNLGLYGRDGTTKWLYPGLRSWQNVINLGSPAPGSMWGSTSPLGIVGRYSGLISYFGTADLVRDDGLFVSQVFEPGSKGHNGPNVFYVEFLAGQMVQPKGSKKIYILSGDQDCRVSEVIGLDTVKDIPGGVYHYTPELAQKASDAWAAYDAQVSSSQPLSLSRGGALGLAAADPVGKTVDAQRSFSAAVSYDAANLYIRYTVTSPSPFVNAIVDPQSIFKGGNLLDIQVGSDFAADPKRTTAAPGDMRLLISERDGKPWAVLMQPKVAGFNGTPIVLTSPNQSESFDSIAATDRVQLTDFSKWATGFAVTAVVPRDLLGLGAMKAGDTLRFDLGYVFGNAGGTGTAVRAYWHNNSFTSSVVNDIPHESRLEPAEWGIARVE